MSGESYREWSAYQDRLCAAETEEQARERSGPLPAPRADWKPMTVIDWHYYSQPDQAEIR